MSLITSHFISIDDLRLYVACNAQNRDKTVEVRWTGDSHIQKFLFGSYIVGYTFVNHVLWLCSRVTVKQDFQLYI